MSSSSKKTVRKNFKLFALALSGGAIFSLMLVWQPVRPNFLQPLVDAIPVNIKSKIKSIIYFGSHSNIPKEENSPVIVVNSDGKPFDLGYNDKIFISKNFEFEIEVNIHSHNDESVCFSFRTKLANSSFSYDDFKACDLGIFPSKVTISAENLGFQKVFFIASNKAHKISMVQFLPHNWTVSKDGSVLDQQEKRTLFVLPLVNIFAYDTFPTRYLSPKGQVFLSTKTIRVKEEDNWFQRGMDSSHSLFNVLDLDNVEVVYDYEIDSIDFEDYDLIIFGLHHEYTNPSTLKNISRFYQQGGDVIALGGAPFLREVKFVDGGIILEEKKLDYKKFDLISFNQKVYSDFNAGKDCKYDIHTFKSSAKNIIVGELVKPFPKSRTDVSQSSSSVDCGGILYPNMQAKCNGNNGCFVFVTSDGLAENMTQLNNADLNTFKQWVEVGD